MDEQVVKYLRALTTEVRNLQDVITRLDTDVRNLRIGGNNTITKTVIFGVKDVSSAQLVDAYRRGLGIQGLVMLANNKYSAEQVYSKLRKAGAVQ